MKNQVPAKADGKIIFKTWQEHVADKTLRKRHWLNQALFKMPG